MYIIEMDTENIDPPQETRKKNENKKYWDCHL